MIESTTGLVTAYVLLAALLASVLLLSNLARWVKAAAVVIVTLFYFVTYHSVFGLMGWPTSVALPEKIIVLASYTLEPDKESGEDGLIYIWADAIIDARPAGVPRAYRLPYNTELHASLEDARKKSRSGQFQIAVSGTGEKRPQTPTGTSGLFAASQEIEFLDLPDPKLPEK